MKKILVVEDDKNISELLVDYLEASNFYVELTINGISALNYIKNKKYDLIILDIMLPGVNGYEILKEIRDENFVPIILLSARKEEIDKIKGLGLGADDYITKPFSFGELIARVNAHILKYERLKNKFKGEEKDVISINGLEIQKETRRVYVDSVEVKLAQKEFDLLIFLAKNKNKVFNKDDLFEIIWGIDSITDSSTVTVHIGRIREKIEKNPSMPRFIETIWGVGYRFKV
ncbi:MAG: response regulator transcription factor [Clostridiales bacterium]